jgi:tRNA-binding protein
MPSPSRYAGADRKNRIGPVMSISYDDFAKVDIRVGTIRAVDAFPEARKPAYKLTIDFGGEIGTKRSSAQITGHYAADALVGRQVLAVVNFPPKRIGPFTSEVLCLGLPDAEGAVVLVSPDHAVPDGARLF